MDIKKEIERILEENGVDITNSESVENIDSIQYVTVIVEVEQFFNIILPDYFLAENTLLDFQKLVNIITEVYENSHDTEEVLNNDAMLSKNIKFFDIEDIE